MRLATLLCLFLLCGCWNVSKEHLTIQYSRLKGSGSLQEDLGRISCEENGKSCGEAKKKDLEEMRDKYERWLKGLGHESVKVKLKTTDEKGVYDATVTSKFHSLTQLPLIKETRVTFLEEESRHDLLLSLELETKADFKAKEFTLTFDSTDGDAVILEHSPAGKLDKDKRSVTWENPEGFAGRVVYNVRLRGKELR